MVREHSSFRGRLCSILSVHLRSTKIWRFRNYISSCFEMSQLKVILFDTTNLCTAPGRDDFAGIGRSMTWTNSLNAKKYREIYQMNMNTIKFKYHLMDLNRFLIKYSLISFLQKHYFTHVSVSILSPINQFKITIRITF